MKTKRQTLETFIRALLHTENPDSEFNVIAYELTHDGCGWSVNTPFRILTSGDLTAVLEAARGRWENFKLNYASKATVSSIEDIASESGEYELEAGQIPFLRIERITLATA